MRAKIVEVPTYWKWSCAKRHCKKDEYDEFGVNKLFDYISILTPTNTYAVLVGLKFCHNREEGISVRKSGAFVEAFEKNAEKVDFSLFLLEILYMIIYNNI